MSGRERAAPVASLTEVGAPPTATGSLNPGRDSEHTRQRILEAALDEFSEKGISGARVDAIAARAQVNKRMLYYYFGSKEGLFKAVLRARFAQAAREQESEDRPPRAERLPPLAQRFVSSPRYVRLLMWEALERGTDAELEEEEIRRAVYGRWVEAEASENPDGAIDPGQVVLAELAMAIFPYAFPQLARLVTGQAPTSPAFRAAHEAFLGWAGAELAAGGRARG